MEANWSHCQVNSQQLLPNNAALRWWCSALPKNFSVLRSFISLQNLESWAKLWQMSFNVTKCKLLSPTTNDQVILIIIWTPSICPLQMSATTLVLNVGETCGGRAIPQKSVIKPTKHLNFYVESWSHAVSMSRSKHILPWLDLLLSMRQLHGIHTRTEMWAK